jgi:hypothetical protein
MDEAGMRKNLLKRRLTDTRAGTDLVVRVARAMHAEAVAAITDNGHMRELLKPVLHRIAL